MVIIENTSLVDGYVFTKRGVKMAYKDLRKLFFADKDNYESIYQNRFSNESAIHLGIEISGNPAFFLITPEILQLSMEILRLNSSLAPLREVLPGKAFSQYRNTCLISEITLTNDIENVHSSRREISDLLSALSQHDNRKRFRGLVNKYAMLLNDEPRQLETCQDIRNIFDEMVSNEIKMDKPDHLPDGNIFRAESVTVYSGSDKPLHQGLYPEKLIIQTMNQALEFLNNETVEKLLRISVFHYLFGYIHPFYDGNGRVSRFISSYLLSGVLDPIVSFHLSLTIKEQITNYYKAFEICNDPRNKGDLTPFVLMFLQIIRDSIKELISDLKAKIGEFKYYLERITVVFPKQNSHFWQLCSLLIQAALFSEDGIPTHELLESMEISRNTLSTYLKKLPEELYSSKRITSNIKHYKMNLPVFEEYSNKALQSISSKSIDNTTI